MSVVASDLVRSLQQSWPAWLPPAMPATGVVPPEHLLAPEVAALLGGRTASLPFFPGGSQRDVAWVTLGPDSTSLLAAMTDLRAWIVPSMGWEDGRGTVVTGGGGQLGASILSLSPSGYIRWRSRADRGVVTEIVRRLGQARELAEAAPFHAQAPVPALIELRQELAAALAANDRRSAEDTLATISRLQLDTAQNALLSRIRVLDHFGDARQLVQLPQLDQLLRVRLPHNARLAVARAFYRHFVEPRELPGDLAAAREAFADQVDPQIGPLLDALRPDAGVEVGRLLAYRAVVRHSSLSRDSLSQFSDDPVVAALLPTAPATPPPPPLSDEDRFFAAWQTRDWAEVQQVGLTLLPIRPDLAPILTRSLEWLPNPALRDAIFNQSPAAARAAAKGDHPPQTWAEWFAAIPGGSVSQLERLLEARLVAGPQPITVGEGHDLAEKLTDLFFTGTPAQFEQGRGHILLTGLAELAGLCIGAKEFPSAGLIELYRAVARCWSEWKRGSAYPPDGQVLLELADGILQLSPADEQWLSDEVAKWWDSRPARALLPFMLGVIEMFHRLAGTAAAERFWIAAGTFVLSKNLQLTLGERLLWRRVGADIGYDAATLDEYVPLPAAPAGAAVADPLQAAGLRKIAVVSTREEQASRAAEQLRARTGADIVVVSDTTGGSETDSAATAEVIAFVWSATTHAVFRAFDKVDRKKLAYVRGTGAASIVLAVERWVMENTG